MSENKDVGSEIQGVLDKAIGIEGFKKGLPKFPMYEGESLLSGWGYRIIAGLLQAALPTTFAYSKDLFKGGEGDYRSRTVTASYDKIREPHRLTKGFGSFLVDIGINALAASMATTGNLQGGMMLKLWGGNVLAPAAAEHVFSSLRKGNATQATGAAPTK